MAAEILHRGRDDPTARAIEHTPWLCIQPVASIPPPITEWRLGAGESSVLALAVAHPGVEAIIDDLAARKCAARLNLPIRGTLGIVLAAKNRGLIPKARPVLEDMLAVGLYLSNKVLDAALQRVGE